MCIRISHKITVTEEKIRQYANLSNDTNPIHLNQTEALRQGFQAPIAHGLLTMGLVMNITSRLKDMGMSISEYDMRFLKPVYRNETMEIVAEAENIGSNVHLKITGKKVTGFVVLHP